MKNADPKDVRIAAILEKFEHGLYNLGTDEILKFKHIDESKISMTKNFLNKIEKERKEFI